MVFEGFRTLKMVKFTSEFYFQLHFLKNIQDLSRPRKPFWNHWFSIGFSTFSRSGSSRDDEGSIFFYIFVKKKWIWKLFKKHCFLKVFWRRSIKKNIEKPLVFQQFRMKNRWKTIGFWRFAQWPRMVLPAHFLRDVKKANMHPFKKPLFF